MASVELHEVSKSFRVRRHTVQPVRALSLQVRDGELLAVVGPSGCGKSTLLRLIAGLEVPDAGEVRIDGRSMAKVPPKDRDVAMVFQDYALYPHMTVRKNLAFGLKMRKTPRDEMQRRVNETARWLGIEPLLDRKPGVLSGGEQQRVALGRAAVRRPNVFLLDEPLSNLDARLRSDMRREIKALHRRIAVTMIYVTHDQEEAMGLADRVAVLGGGAVRQCAGPLEVYQKPADRYVAEFMGSVPMSMVPGEAETRGEAVAIRTKTGTLHWPVTRKIDSARRGSKSILVGFRPESARLSSPGDGAHEDALRGTVTSIEPAGSRAIVFVDIEGERPIACECAALACPSPGDAVGVRIDLTSACLFDLESEKRISD